MPDLIDEACITIARDTGYITDCNTAACELLAVEAEQLRGRVWMRALGCDAHHVKALDLAVRCRRPLLLPPFVIRRGDGDELAAAGLVLPSRTDPSATALIFWPVLGNALASISPPPTVSDTLAVLGIDRLRVDETGAAEEIALLMEQVGDSLRDILRTRDALSTPVGSALLIVFRDLDVESATDICRALLSHLHRVCGDSGAGLRIAVGLAHMTRERGALHTLLAANNALLQARTSGTAEQLRVERVDDYPLLISAAIHAAGVFGAEHTLRRSPESEPSRSVARGAGAPPVQPIERDIEGYVVDNMEGAVDQAMFLARLDVPVAIIGPAGTGKMYVAKIIHEQWGGAEHMLVQIDCREFRGRRAANARILRELADAEGRTIVFKSPHLMNSDAQVRLARQVSSRILADSSPPRALPRTRLVALFPDTLDRLIRRGELTEQLASAFAGFPITVPPIRDRKQAVLRWAHKILGQEGALRDRYMKGFTPDAERAMLQYDWPGNISEMRRCISHALDQTDRDWLTPVDLGLFKGIDPEGTPASPESRPFLANFEKSVEDSDSYAPTALETVDMALAEAVHSMLELELVKPLGIWLQDDVVLAALDRYRNDMRLAGNFLHTRPRNISRWLPKIEAREEERNSSALWQPPRRLLWDWVRESPQLEDPPLRMFESMLLTHVESQAGALSSARRAQILGVSTPTYLKRLRELTHA
ncbi:MAG: sigma 54-interacting transcriptional regulator [Halioglobus sp.]|nr:sigma 54-interacting transcriptional regulator [Halioglobus sp.]